MKRKSKVKKEMCRLQEKKFRTTMEEGRKKRKNKKERKRRRIRSKESYEKLRKMRIKNILMKKNFSKRFFKVKKGMCRLQEKK